MALYECFSCGDELPLEEGIATCAAHFACKPCILHGATLALSNPECFPVKCCAPLSHVFIERVLDPASMTLYVYKALEYNTPTALRAYCYNKECQQFIPPNWHDNSSRWHSVARCPCGTTTCVGCKSYWRNDRHRCNESNSEGERPHGLPDYTSDCRIKLCPDCRLPLEHKEACNHMTCARCRHEFCFVCMLPWTGFHDDAGCPQYGDPSVGYDDEGYERSTRGLHLDTGLDRTGLDRLGRSRQLLSAGHHAFDDDFEHHDQYWGNDDQYWEGDDDNFEEPFDENEEIHDDHTEAQEDVAGLHEDEYHPHGSEDGSIASDPDTQEDVIVLTDHNEAIESDQVATEEWVQDATAQEEENSTLVASEAFNTTEVQPSAAPTNEERSRLHLQRHVGIFQPRPANHVGSYQPGSVSFAQEDCDHYFRCRQSYVPTPYYSADCSICSFHMRYYFNFCIHCGIIVCEYCTSNFQGRHDYYNATGMSRISVLQWAEDGVPIFRAELRRYINAAQEEIDSEDADLGLQNMIETYEEHLFLLQHIYTTTSAYDLCLMTSSGKRCGINGTKLWRTLAFRVPRVK